MREKAVWLTEGVTLSGALRGGTVCGHTLESAILAAEGVRIEIQISQAKGQSIYMLIPILFGRNQSTIGRHKR